MEKNNLIDLNSPIVDGEVRILKKCSFSAFIISLRLWLREEKKCGYCWEVIF